MSDVESFRGKFKREGERISQEQRAVNIKREEKLRVDKLRFLEGITAQVEPLINTLHKSRILDYIDAMDISDMEVEIDLKCGYGDKIVDRAGYRYQASINIGRDGELRWGDTKAKDIWYKLGNVYRQEHILPHVSLAVELRWDFWTDSHPDTGDFTRCKFLDIRFTRENNRVNLRIGRETLKPEQWDSPEILQDTLIQEFLEKFY